MHRTLAGYHETADPASAKATTCEWWLRPVLVEVRDQETTDLLARTLTAAIECATPAVRRAALHTANAIARLAKIRRGAWTQVSAMYVMQGAGVSRPTARQALGLVCGALLCSRTAEGMLTTTLEARAACVQVVDQLGAPMPEVHRDDLTAPSGEVVWIDTPSPRGRTRCPCGEHAKGDEHPSLAYDLRTGLATCQVTRTVYQRTGTGWVMVRKRNGIAGEHGAILGTSPNQYQGGESRGGSLPRPDALGWGGHLLGLLHHDGLHRSEAEHHRDLPSIMRAAERQGDRAEEVARYRAIAGLPVPDRLVSLDRHALDRDATCWRETRDGRWYPARPAWRQTATELVCFDLDGLRDADPRAVDPAIVSRVRAVLEDAGVEAETIVATSRTGVQVVARLPGWYSPDRLHHDLRSRRWLRSVGAAVLAAVARDGWVDPSSWAPGRMIRRPGWRVKGGEAVRATLWWCRT